MPRERNYNAAISLEDRVTEGTAEKRRDFAEALARREARQTLAGRAAMALLALAVGGGVLLRVPESWWVTAAGTIALLAVGFRLVNWKCPGCGTGLPLRRRSGVCLGCGAPLD